uniref:Uncharacterized protein n=1 Tax=Oryza meridionalis TaxID=40149 RepID=A0A0E0CUI8_9ORYZ
MMYSTRPERDWGREAAAAGSGVVSPTRGAADSAAAAANRPSERTPAVAPILLFPCGPAPAPGVTATTGRSIGVGAHRRPSCTGVGVWRVASYDPWVDFQKLIQSTGAIQQVRPFESLNLCSTFFRIRISAVL